MLLIVMMVRQLLVMMMPMHHQGSMVAQVRIGILVHPVMMMVVRRSQSATAQGHGSIEGASCGCLAGQQILHLPLVSAKKMRERKRLISASTMAKED